MQSAEIWQPTKFVSTPRGLRASRDPKYMSVSSRFVADITAAAYERHLRAHATGRMLDMGCGHVPLYGVYRDLVKETICIDWGKTLHANPHLDFAVDLSGPLPFSDAEFDTILLTDVLEHLPEPLSAMREASRILRRGGRIIVGVPFMYWLHEEPHDYYRYTEFALRRFCELSCLRVLDLKPYGGAPEVILDMASKVIGNLPKPVASALRPFHSLSVMLSSTWPGRKLSSATSESFPLGYMMVAERI